MASIALLSQVECAEIFTPASEIQPHRQLQLTRSKRICRLHETRRLLKIGRIVSWPRLLRVLNELPCRIIEAVVGQPEPLIIAIEQIERLCGQLQMIPSAQIHLSFHSQVLALIHISERHE